MCDCNTEDKLKQLLLNKEWDKVQLIVSRQPEVVKSNSWIFRELAWGMLECGKMDQAMRYGELAYQASPGNVFVIWEFASILWEGGEDRKAISLFKRILRKKPQTIRRMFKGKSEKLAVAFQNDCRFRIGLAYHYMGESALSLKWFSRYIENREAGVSSDYSLVEARRTVATLRNVKAIEGFIKKEEWDKVKPLVRKELRKCPDDAWLLTQLSAAYFSDRKYEKSLEIIEKAFKLSPRDPIVIWRRAEGLYFCDRGDEAIELYKRIIGMGVERLALEGRGNGIRWAESLINDCVCSVGMCYCEKGSVAVGMKWLERHLANRRRGLMSIYVSSKIVATLEENRLKRKGR
jgi:tetratricopeptide (TPR) repeat protein